MNDETTQLNELLSYCRSAAKGYATASEQVDAPALRALFERNSRRHAAFAYELEQQLLILGEEPKDRANIPAGAHRLWINIKGLLSAQNADAILRECLRGEQEAAKHFQQTLDDHTFSNDIRLLLARQMEQIEEMRDDLNNRIKN